MRKQEIPVNPRSLPDGPLYFVGIGGAGMSAIAYVLAQRGVSVSGSDPGISAATRARLESVGVTVFAMHDAAQIGADIVAVVVTDAVNETNAEIMAARERGIPVFRRPEALAHIFNHGRGIAIAGTHGKTTTTAMVASILLAAGLKPTILIGGDLPAIGGNAVNGDPNAPGGDIVLAESCEAYDGFLYLHPEIAVITNIEADHLDFHGTEEAVFDSFRRFIRQVKPDGHIIFSDDDRNTNEIYNTAYSEDARSEVQQRAEWSDYSVGKVAEMYTLATRFEGSNPEFTLEILSLGERIPIHLNVPGKHNISNALAAALVSWNIGEVKLKHIIAGLEAFTGTGRRFEKLGEVNGVLVVDDYAHHPTEIRATLSAAQSAYPDRRVVAVFQPHLPSRTRDFMDDFASALSSVEARQGQTNPRQSSTSPLQEEPKDLLISPEALPLSPEALPMSPEALPQSPDTLLLSQRSLLLLPDDGKPVVVVTDIYLAREQPIAGVTSETLANKVRAINPQIDVLYVADKNTLPETLASLVYPGDLVLTMGAGDIRKAGEGLLQLLSSPSEGEGAGVRSNEN